MAPIIGADSARELDATVKFLGRRQITRSFWALFKPSIISSANAIAYMLSVGSKLRFAAFIFRVSTKKEYRCENPTRSTERDQPFR